MTVRNTTFILAVAIAFAVRGADLVYDVAEGETNTVTVAINADTANVDRIIKRGAGTLQLTNSVGSTRNFAAMIVEGGKVELSMGADAFKPTNVVIKTGAEVWNTGGKAVFVSSVSFDLERDSFLYLGGVANQAIDGFRGYGVVSNKASVVNKPSLSKGPYRFGGRVVGKPIFECSGTSGSANSHRVFVVCASNTLAEALWRTGGGTVTNLTFASGIGAFRISELDAGGGTGRPIPTVDESGEPITLTFGPYNYGFGTPFFFGNGKVVLVRGRYTDVTMSGGAMFDNFTGTIACHGGINYVGSKTAPGQRPDVSRLSGVECISGDGSARFGFHNENGDTNYFNCTVYAARNNGFACTLDFMGPTVVKRFKARGINLNSYTNLSMKSGRLEVSEGGFNNKNPGCSLEVENGSVSGFRGFSSSNRSWSKLRYPAPISAMVSSNYLRLLVGQGGEAMIKDKVPNTVVSAGGVFTAGGGIEPNTGGTSSNPTTILLDGGTFRLSGYEGSAYGLVVNDYSEKLRLAVGAGGMTLEMFSETGIWTDTMCYAIFYNPFVSGVELGTDGGITRIGGGHIKFNKPLTITGPFRALDGTIDFLESSISGYAGSSDPFLGDGEFEMGNAVVRYDAEVATSCTLYLGTTGGFRTSGAATFRLKTSASQPVNIRLGNFSRDRGSALFLYSDIANVSAFSPASSGIVSVSGGLETNDVGLVKAPVFLRTVPTGVAAGSMQFATYDAVNDRVDAFTGMTEGVVEGTVANVESAAVTIPTDTTVSVRALRVCGIAGSAPSATRGPVFLQSGAVLRVGDGVDPACVILTSPSADKVAGIMGLGTLDFGASEGVVAVNRTHEANLGAKVSGSGGVLFVSAVDGGLSTLKVSGENTYTGGTVINGLSVKFSGASPFGSGKVRCGGGKVGGGRLWFNSNGLSLANDLVLSGYGPTRGDAGQFGALFFTASGTASGDIELTGKTRIVAGNASTVAELSGSISGDMLQAWNYGFNESGAVPGNLLLSHANSYTGGTEIVGCTLTLKGEGTLGTGKVVLDGGTLVLDKDGDVTLENLVEGVGTIAVASRGVHTFTNLDSEDDAFALGLLNKRCTVASLDGFSSVTNMTAKSVDLYVLDGSNEKFKGEVYGVTLHTGECPAVGSMIIVR